MPSLESVATQAMTMYTSLSMVEDVTWYHKDEPTDTPTSSTVTMVLHRARLGPLDVDVIQKGDLLGRIPTASVAFALTDYDEFVRADGTRWRVLSHEGGPGHAFWRPQCRQVA